MELKIKVTKDVLSKSAGCNPTLNGGQPENCAVALAVREIFPNARVGYTHIHTHGVLISHPAALFIQEFDQLSPSSRVKMAEFSFCIDAPESIINQINIDDIHKSETLEVVSL